MRTMNVKKNLALMVAVILMVSIFIPVIPASAALNYTNSWVGNTFGGKDEKWVQNQVFGFYVAPNGTCYANSPWDEEGRECGIYKDGDVIGKVEVGHGGGGWAITGDGTSLYVGRGDGFSKFNYSGGSTSGLYLSGRRVTGLGVNNGKLYVSHIYVPVDSNYQTLWDQESDGKITVYNTSNMSEITTWSLDKPRGLTVDSNGDAWIIQGATDVNSEKKKFTAKIVKYNGSGAKLSEITGLENPTSVAIDNQGRLMITENGVKQQVLIYSVSGTPSQVATFGDQYGIYSGTRGEYGDRKFYGLKGVGTDSSGNIYVACNGFNWGGTDIRKFNSGGTLQWKLLGLEFVDVVDADASSDFVDVYSKDEHFVIDYSKTTPGTEWSYKGFIHDPFTYPEDPRLLSTMECAMVRTINGKKFLFTTDMYSSFMMIYRFDYSSKGEIAIPSALIAHDWSADAIWPANRPSSKYWLWRDKNGNGRFEADEYEVGPEDYPFGKFFSVDANGNVWKSMRTQSNGIRSYTCGGLDSYGNPIYSYASSTLYNVPDPIKDPHRVFYDTASDSIYITGFTDSYPAVGDEWKIAGSEMVRIDNWKNGTKTQRFRKYMIYDATNDKKIMGFSVAGDYVFAVEGRDAVVHVYDNKTGNEVGTMTPTADTGSYSGWTDVANPINAVKRSTGEYIVFVEEDGKGKNMMYRWNPGGSTPTPTPTPTPAPGTGSNLALNKTVTSSSNESGNEASKAVDGNTGTRWASLSSDPQWIYVDLGATYKIDRVKLNWEAAYGKDYKIQVSTSGTSTWTDVKTVTGGDGGIDDHTFTATDARYVRMYGTVRATQWGYSLYEFEVYGVTNLATGKTATASSIEGTGYEAGKAVDGNTSTRWASTSGSDPQWIYVDLGSSQSISRVKLNWEAAYGKDYKIQVSTSGTSSWTDVKTVTGGDGGIDDHTFTATNARYVRMYGTARGSQWGYSLYEFEVYN